ncbi:MAG: hypothetical protein ACOX4U_03250 [Anaerovoracaceae bacterium]
MHKESSNVLEKVVEKSARKEGGHYGHLKKQNGRVTPIIGSSGDWRYYFLLITKITIPLLAFDL